MKWPWALWPLWVFALGWAVWAVFGVAWELIGVVQGRGMLTGFFFALSRHMVFVATVTAFMTWWYWHWFLEPYVAPGLKGPGLDDAALAALAWLITFFGRRKK